MAWASIRLQAGLNTELTQTANIAGYSATGLGRFKNGLFQKLGGWTKYFGSILTGATHKLHAWQDLNSNKRLAVGTGSVLYDITSGTARDISPQTLTTNPAINFTTTIGSMTVTIIDTAVNNITPFDVVYFNTPISVGGLILSGAYAVTTNISATSYTITAATAATGAITNGGTVPAFTTTSSSSNVTVTLTAHGLVVGNDIVFPLATAVGGVTIQGRYVVQSVTDANNFVITGPNAASSSAGPTSMNSGNAGFLYYIALGPQIAGAVYGSGLYGAGTYGYGVALSGQTGTNISPSNWTLDNWGEILIACPENYGIFYWGPNSGYQNCALVAGGPLFNGGAFVSIGQQIVVVYASTQSATVGSYQDPLLVSWSDVGNFLQWTPLVTNQAGSYRIPSGSRIIGGAATPSRNLIWTDLDVWSMDYVGATFVFSFNKVGSNCGLISKHAHAQLGGIVYWMSRAAFFALTSGGAQQIPCTVWDAVFQDLDTANIDKCFAGSNTLFSEVFFFFPSISGGSGKCDRYAKYNTVEGTWDYGILQRSAWIDQSVINYPLATAPSATNSIVYSHENGYDADDAPINSSFETGWFYIDEGREIVFIDRIFPDFKWGTYAGSQNASVLITVKSVMYPGDTPTIYGPFTVTQASQFISQRLRARQLALRVDSNDVGTFWRLGQVRFRYTPDGRR